MCGLSAVILLNNRVNYEQLKQNLIEMTAQITHRGPDAHGFYCDENLLLGHRRLSIQDGRDDANQPFKFLNCIIIFNGEIYNFRALREELRCIGYKFNTDSDTEVIIASYKAWGEKCVNRFNGMWAFVLYDIDAGLVLCSRDRFGEKPLYMVEQNQNIFLFSEVRQFRVISKELKINDAIAVDYLVNGVVDFNEETFFESIKRVMPGHNLVIELKSKKTRTTQFYELQFKQEYYDLNLPDAISLNKELLNDAIELRIHSGHGEAALLSGGLDSSAIVANVVKLNSPIHTFYARNKEQQNDEIHFVNLVENELRTDHHTFEMTPDDIILEMQNTVYAQEYPFLSSSLIMQYLIYKKIHNNKFKIVLDGQGADEILLGYKKYFSLYLKSQSGYKILSSFKEFSNNNSIGYTELMQLALYFSNPMLKSLKTKSKTSLLKGGFDANTSGGGNLTKDYTKRIGYTFELQKFEIETNSLPALLRYGDKNSMAHSIENRNPFLDYRLLEFCTSLPITYKIRDGWSKYILRASLIGMLPKEVIWRTNKTSFVGPEKIYRIPDFINHYKQEIEKSEALLKYFKRIPTLESISDIWRFYNFALWAKHGD